MYHSVLNFKNTFQAKNLVRDDSRIINGRRNARLCSLQGNILNKSQHNLTIKSINMDGRLYIIDIVQLESTIENIYP